MPVANFEILSQGIAELAGLPAPGLHADGKGARAFCIRLEDVPFTVMESDHGRPGMLLLMAELGAVAEEEALAQWSGLLACNTPLFGVDAPRFGRNPRSGGVVLLWLCQVDTLNLTEIHLRLARMATVASSWMRDRAPPSEPAWHAPHVAALGRVDAMTAAEAAQKFVRLHADMCAALGQVAASAPGTTTGVLLPLQFDGHDVVLAHFPESRPDDVMVMLRMALLLPAPEVNQLTDLMDANFLMGLNPGGPVFCHDPATGELLMRWEYALHDGSARDWLLRTGKFVKLARDWAAGMALPRGSRAKAYV